MILQLVGIGIASAGFAILQLASDILDFSRLNPDSSNRQGARVHHAARRCAYSIAWSDLALVTLLVMLLGLLAGYLGLRLGNSIATNHN